MITDRHMLRQLLTDDLQYIFDLHLDTEINQHLDRTPCETIEDAITFINKIKTNNTVLHEWTISFYVNT